MKEIKRDFNRSVKSYDKVGLLQQKVAKRTVEIFRQQEFELAERAKILDLGSGTGALAKLLPEYDLFQLDCAYNMCEQASHLGQVVNGNMELLPFKKDAFDAVISSLAIQWCSDYKKLFDEINHVVKNQQAVLSTLGVDTLRELKECFYHVEGSRDRVKDFTAIEQVRQNIHGDHAIIHEPIKMIYPDFNALLTSIRAIGGANKQASRKRGLTKKNLQKLELNYMDNYSCEGGIYAVWDVSYIVLKG